MEKFYFFYSLKIQSKQHFLPLTSSILPLHGKIYRFNI